VKFVDKLLLLFNPKNPWEKNKQINLKAKTNYNPFMKPIEHINNAITDLDKVVEELLLDWSINLTEKDNIMLPLLQQKKVLKQALEDLTYLEEHPPTPNQACGISKYRED